MNIPSTPHERNSRSRTNSAYTDNHTTSSGKVSSNSNSERYGWTKFSKLKETCPICNGAHKRCSTTGQLVICAEDWQVPGWSNKGQDKAGIGYLYSPDRNQLSEYRKLPQPKPTPEAKQTAHTPQELDQLFNELLRSQPVEPWAEANLVRRGIKPSGLLGKSFPKGIIDGKYETLPGSYRDGMGKLRFNVPRDSYFCPIFNEQNLIVGGQLKVKGGKYIWLSAGSKGGISQHINGKTPHTLCNSNTDKRVKFADSKKSKKNVILFSEGCLKPYIINQLSGHPVIGAVGGNFGGNFESIADYVATITNNNPDHFSFALAADAESGLNDSVIKNYKALAKFTRDKYDKDLHVVWYGQYNKRDDDLDEVLATTKTDYHLISFVSFKNKFREYKLLTDSKRFSANCKISERFLPVDDDYWGDSKNAIVDFAKRIGKKHKAVLAIKSPMGTGKTEALKKLLSLLHNGVFLLGYRNSLLRQTGSRIPAIYHQSMIVDKLQFSDPRESVSLCVDSLLNIKSDDVKDKVLIFDEAPLVFEHLLTGETCKDKRDKLLLHLKVLLENCAGIVVMSDQLTDSEVNFISELSLTSTDNIIKVANTYQMPSRTIFNYEKETTFKQSLHDDIKAGKKVLILSDSQKFTDNWGRKIKQEINSQVRVLVVNSQTHYKEEVGVFLEYPNQSSSLYDVVICSPTAESGLSIDIRGYFDAVYVHWNHLGLDACEQMMHRYRDENCPIHFFGYRCWNSDKTDNDINFEVQKLFAFVLTEYITEARKNKELLDSDILQELVSIRKNCNPLTLDYLRYLKLKRLWEQHSFRALLLHSLIERGYNIKTVSDGEVNKEEISTFEQSEEIKNENTNFILMAKDLTSKEFDEASRQEAKTPYEIAEIVRYSLKQQLPGVEKKDIWNFDFIKEVTQNCKPKLKQLWLRFLATNPDLNHALTAKKVFDYAEYGVCPWDIDNKYAEAKSLSELLLPLIDGEELSSEHPLVQSVVEKANKIHWLPKQKGHSNMKYLGVLLELIGYGLKGRQKRAGNDKRIWFYTIVDKSDYKVSGENNSIKSHLIYPEIKDCFEVRKQEILNKYDETYFKERGIKCVDSRRDREVLETEGALNSMTVNDRVTIALLEGDVVDIRHEGKHWGMCDVVEVVGNKAKAVWGFGAKQKVITFGVELIEKIWRMGVNGLAPVWSAV